MTERVAAAYEICLQALQSGASLESCLGLFPDLAAELDPALQAAVWLGQLPPGFPSSAAQARSRNRVLARTAQARSKSRASFLRQPLPRAAFALVVMLIAFVAGWGGLTTAAAQALPGETLYRVKRAEETLRMGLARDEQTRQTLQLAYKERREDEARELLRLGRKGSVTFEGIVEGLADTRWTVSSLPVELDATTRILGSVELGDSVIVVGATRPQGDILASEIRLHTYQLIGNVEQQSDTSWTVSGQTLLLLPTSQVQPGIKIGDGVLALVEVRPDAKHAALVIVSLAPGTALPGVSPQGTPRPQNSPPPSPEHETDGDEIELTGIVEDQQGSAWTISGWTFTQTTDTEVRGDIQVGDRVKVRASPSGSHGWILLRVERVDSNADNLEDDSSGNASDEGDADGELEATHTPEPQAEDDDGQEQGDAEPEEVRFSGAISSISSSQWVIGGQAVEITPNTELDEDLGVGDEADVRALRFLDGRLEAERIEAAD